MTRRLALLIGFLLTISASVGAQSTDELALGKLYLGAVTGCALQSGSGSPEGAVTGSVCDSYLRTDTADWYVKASGTGTNTGWIVLAVRGSGTANTIPKWTATTTLGDSVVSEDSGNLVVGAHLLPSLTDTYDIGRYDKFWNQGYIAQINAVIFALETQTLFGGYSTIGYNAGGFAAAVGSGDTTVNFGKTMTPGHFVVVRGQDTSGAYTAEYMEVGTLVSGYVYNVTRNLSGLGAKNWASGTPFLVLGANGTGRIDLLAYDGKPRIVFTTQGTTYNAQTPHAAIGNLNGYYGYATDTYAAAFGEAATANLLIDATNGVRMRYGTANRMVLGATSLAFYGPDDKLRADMASGYLALYGDNTNSYLIADASGLRVIANGAARVTVNNDGTASFVGDGGSVTNINGGNIQTGTVTASRLEVSADAAALNADPTFTDGNAWTLTSTARYAGSGHGAYYVQSTPGVGTATVRSAGKIPIDQSKVYRVSGWGERNTAANGLFYLGVSEYDASDTFIVNQYVVSAVTPPDGSWAFYSGNIPSFNASTVYVRCLALVNWTGTAGWNNVANLRLEEVLPSTLIQDGAIVTDKLAANAVTAAKIAANTITAAEIASNAITTDELNADSVTSAKIAANTIVAGDIAAGTITTTEIAANTITAADIAAGTITTTEIAANTITAADIAAGTITTTQIASNTIEAGNMNVSTLSAITANVGTLTGGTIDGVTVRAGTGDEVTLDSSGISIAGGTGDNNKIKWAAGAQLWGTTSGGLYTSGNLTVEGTINVTGTGAGANAIIIAGGYGIAADTLDSPNMASSTGTAVIWESSCGCLKKDSSSLRYKENIRAWIPTDIAALLDTPFIRFDYRGDNAKNVVGLSAEALYNVSPDLVNLDAEGRPDSVRQAAMNAYLIAAIRQLKEEIEVLRNAK